jgi:catechol 2,3-dioxygenase-like lactoylglutathione lyase family enzyme
MIARVTDLQYVGLAVPDLDAERKFFGETWGLVEVGTQGPNIYFAAASSEHPFVIRLRQDDERKTDVIGFSCDSQNDLRTIFAQAIAAGAKPISEPATAPGPAGGYACRFFDIDGRCIEVICEAKKREPRTLERGEAIPTGLSHVVLHSPNIKLLVKFYEEAMGFRLSDWIGEFMVFLRCNRAHHRLAVLPGPPALNHVAFDVVSIDDLMRGLARLTNKGVTLQWGPGRHTAGNNTFTYYATPNGNVVEYTSDLEEVDEAVWQPTTYEMSPSITDQWGTGRIITGNVPFKESAADAGLWKIPA